MADTLATIQSFDLVALPRHIELATLHIDFVAMLGRFGSKTIRDKR